MERDAKNGAYLAVSSRGNFFLTWEPGQDFWVPHNRGTARRIQNMGFIEVTQALHFSSLPPFSSSDRIRVRLSFLGEELTDPVLLFLFVGCVFRVTRPRACG